MAGNLIDKNREELDYDALETPVANCDAVIYQSLPRSELYIACKNLPDLSLHSSVMDIWQELSVVWYGFFWAAKISLYAVDIILDFLTGYSITMGSREERTQSQDYSHSAHLVKIVSRGGFSTILDHEAHNFLWLHQCYLHPENILLDKNVVMYAMTTTHAYFTIATEDLYDVEVRYLS